MSSYSSMSSRGGSSSSSSSSSRGTGAYWPSRAGPYAPRGGASSSSYPRAESYSRQDARSDGYSPGAGRPRVDGYWRDDSYSRGAVPARPEVRPEDYSRGASTSASVARPGPNHAPNYTRWQDALDTWCRNNKRLMPKYSFITDKRGGRTAWSSLVTVGGIQVPARFWYSSEQENNAREDAAEAALQALGIVPRPCDLPQASKNWSGSR